MRFAFAFLTATALALPAHAQDAASPITHTWMDSVSRSGPAAPEPWGTVKQVYGATIGTHAVALEETPLADLAALIGTEAHHWGEAGEAVTWACLARNAETLWLYSDGEMGEGKVTGIAIDVRDPAPASAGCGPWPADLTVDLGMMGIGMPADMIAANYLTGQPDEYGWFRSINLSDPGQVWQELTFRANADGTVDAMAVLQQSGS